MYKKERTIAVTDIYKLLCEQSHTKGVRHGKEDTSSAVENQDNAEADKKIVNFRIACKDLPDW